MAKKPSAVTELRRAKRELAQARMQIGLLKGDCDRHVHRATKAEQEAADWRRRFDDLLMRCKLIPANEST